MAAWDLEGKGIDRSQMTVALREAQLTLDEVQLKRVTQLVPTNAASKADLDPRTAERDVAKASLDGAKVAAIVAGNCYNVRLFG
jgi:HlyD family secretion protein